MAKKLHLQISDKVLRILTKYPKSRDKNRFLEAACWNDQMLEQGIDPKKITAQDFLRLYADEKFTEGAIVGRVSRLIQVVNVSLRGENFEKNRGIKKRNETLVDLIHTEHRVK